MSVHISCHRQDIMQKHFASLWSMPADFLSTKTVSTTAIAAVTIRCIKNGSCTMCKKNTDESHNRSAVHLTNAKQQACFDEVLGTPADPSSARNLGDLLRTFPLTQQSFKAYWGADPECLLQAARMRITKHGHVLVKPRNTKPAEPAPVANIKQYSLMVVSYSGEDSKYKRHFGVPWDGIPETPHHELTSPQALPPKSGFWPVVALSFKDHEYEWEDVADLDPGTMCAAMDTAVATGAEMQVRVTWIWVVCVYQVWWEPPTAWPVRVIRSSL